jgi:EmrB/QacA subfamily drug resistance transporter
MILVTIVTCGDTMIVMTQQYGAISVPELTPRRRLLILAICCLSLLIVGMDNTIVNVALPSIGANLHASLSGLQWTIDAYTVTIASLLILSGSTGDRFGRRRTFQAGLALFVISSLLCSLAPGLGWLIAFRMLQAVGGSMLNPVAMGIITNVFTEPRERARAIGVWGGVVGISLGLGPVVGGALTETVGWRAIFWVNIPIGVLAFVLAALFVPESKAARARRIDPVGQLLVIGILAALTYAIIDGPSAGWISVRVWGLFLLVGLAFWALLYYERRRTEPLIEVRFFRSTPFAGATVIAVCSFAAFSGFLFMVTLYLQDVRGLSALRAGLFIVPMAVTTVVVGPISGRMVGNRGSRLPLLIAGGSMLLGVLMLTGLTSHTSYVWLLASFVVFAVGVAMVNVPITNAAVSGMPREQAGVAAAFASTSRQVGTSLGVAIAGSVINSGVRGGLASGLSAASHPAWWIIAGCEVVVIVVGLASTSRRARLSVDRTAALLEDQPAVSVAA